MNELLLKMRPQGQWLSGFDSELVGISIYHSLGQIKNGLLGLNIVSFEFETVGGQCMMKN
jgi:hypothetical protein